MAKGQSPCGYAQVRREFPSGLLESVPWLPSMPPERSRSRAKLLSPVDGPLRLQPPSPREWARCHRNICRIENKDLPTGAAVRRQKAYCFPARKLSNLSTESNRPQCNTRQEETRERD